MNKKLITLMAAALALLSASGQVTFTGYGKYAPKEITPEKSTSSLKKIFVVYDTDSVKMHYASMTGERAKWSTFDSYPAEIPGVQWDGYKTTLNKVIPNTGYIIEDGINSYYCWVVNYADYYLEFNDLFVIDDTSCSLWGFRVDGHAPKIPYKNSITGSTTYLDREIILSYKTQVWDESTNEWTEDSIHESFESLDDGIVIDPPLCKTGFTLRGDRFLREWHLEDTVQTNDEYESQAVSCKTTAEQEVTDSLATGLGGSAPVHIIFTGYPTSNVVFRVWEMATDTEFENIIMQFNQDVVDYTFYETGTFYMRYRVANSDGSCQAEGEEVYTISVDISELKCPNVFSPGTTEDINDVWKVYSKSLIEFHCWIFNRWGTCVCEFTDPNDGWDGRYKGRLVDTGVYYYVITALGSDGKQWKEKGDISILRYKGNNPNASTDFGGGGY